MRLFLQKDLDIFFRKQFIESLCNLYLLRHSYIINDFYVLETYPFSWENNLVLIYGHHINVLQLLHNYNFVENNIYIITCSLFNEKKFCLESKKMYICPQYNGMVRLYNGNSYGFDFDITDVELNIYNSKLSFKQALDKYFIMLQ